jgi:stage II sporulation protein D
MVVAVAAVAFAAGCHHRRSAEPETPPVPTPQPATQPGPSVPDARRPADLPRPPAEMVPRDNEPVVRVGIVVDRDSAAFSATGQFRVLDAGGGALAVADAGRTWVVRAGDGTGRLLLSRPDRADPVALAAPVLVRTEREGDFVQVAGRRYRGELLLQRGTAGITVVNRLPMEQYLLSVVALELGFRSPSDRQAVLAQAVAARTYGVRYRGRREALGFDVFPTDADQAYSGVESELPEVVEAVRATAGEILTFQGQPIQALFHSTCGWSTEAAEQVFQNREPVPYLRPTSDRFGDGDRDFYCAVSPKFRWREEWDADGLNAVLARSLPAILGTNGQAIGRLTDIRAGRTTPTGRVAELVVTTTNGSYTVGRVREVLRPSAGGQLQSSMFQLHVTRDGGALTRVVAAGAGFGHGVGMCQFGAVGRARAGQGYRQILATYYHGTTLERSY